MKPDIKKIILIGLDDDRSEHIQQILKPDKYIVSVIQPEDVGETDICKVKSDCVIVDFRIWCGNTLQKENSSGHMDCPFPPVVVLGDRSDESSIEESFKKGADEFIPYPFSGSELSARIDRQVKINRSRISLEEEVEKRTHELQMSNTLLNESLVEYKKLLKDLQENETLLLTIAFNIPNSYLAIVERNFTISFAAGQEFKKNNIDPWQLIGLPLEKIMKDKAEYVMSKFMSTFAGEEISFEMELNHQYLLYKSVPLFNNNDVVTRILVVAENITERRISDIQINESLKEKETLLKEIHHRVKNNMQLVCSMINLHADSIENGDVYDIFKVLQSRIYSMSLVHEKLYNHKQLSKINFTEYVRELVKEISNSFARSTGDKSAKIELELHDEDFTIDRAIPCGLILNELILNAFKHASFSSGEGCIKVVFNKLENDSYRLAVSDNGKGLPDDFDINRSDSMGMTLVRELVSQLRGSISVYSGSETVFTVLFGDDMRNNELSYTHHERMFNKNILLVEDERIISRMLRKILEESGYNIIDSVTSGREAIESAIRTKPDLVVMDIMLEDEIDGVEAASIIMKDHKCPIIFLTGNSDAATIKSAYDINPYEMLTKPVDKIRLIETIQSALR